jgi:hypothetical protein
MNRNILVTTMLCVLLAGCFAPSPHVKGEKLGPGHCRQSGVVEISILKFQRPPNATLTIKIQSLEQDTNDPSHEHIGAFVWLGILLGPSFPRIFSKRHSELYYAKLPQIMMEHP